MTGKGWRASEPGAASPVPRILITLALSLTHKHTQQAFLKKNNELIRAVMAQQAKALAQEQGENDEPTGTGATQGSEAAGAPGVDKALLQQCAGMIKELNENLTQVRVFLCAWGVGRLSGVRSFRSSLFPMLNCISPCSSPVKQI